MGRRQHLARLALGRSAFEDIDEAESRPDLASSSQGSHDNNSQYQQQYNSKGRPINPAIEDFNSDLRDAQNAVLELVGVVERKDRSDQFDQLKQSYLRDRRNTLLSQEDEYGEILEWAIIPVAYLSKLWASALLERVQIGYYDHSLSMIDILTKEWAGMIGSGGKVFLMGLFPAFGGTSVHYAMQYTVIISGEQITGRLQNWFAGGRLSHRNVTRMYTATSWLFLGFLFLVDAYFLPLEFYATAQRLGLAPPTTILPRHSSLWLRSTDSFHRYGWQPVISTSIIRRLSSPGLLMMFNKVVRFEAYEQSTPILSIFTNFRYPDINETQSHPTFLLENRHSHLPFQFSHDPIGWLLNKQYHLRQRLLKWTGWNITLRFGAQRREIDTSPHDDNSILYQRPWPIYRSTHLAHLPAKVLATSIDKLLSSLILLPFQSLMLRTIAATYISTPSTAKSFTGLAASSSLYRPFGGSPLLELLRTPASYSAREAFGIYTSRLCLALALNAAVDTLVFFGIYWTTRRIGVAYFDWGVTGPIGKTIDTYRHRDSGSSLITGGTTSTRTGSRILSDHDDVA